MKKILITGGAGNIGSSFAELLSLSPENEIVIVDNLSTGEKNKIPNRQNVTFIKADANSYNEMSAIMVINRFDFVFHFAAVVGVKRTLQNPLLVLSDIDGIRNILELSKNTSVRRIFFSSSSEVYGEPVEIPQFEDTTPLNSKLPYAIVKNIGEAYLKSFYQEFGLEYTVFRFFNTYGPKQSTDFVISKFIMLALQNRDITIYGDGSQTRTFCYIKDNIETMELIMEKGLFINDVVNIGNDNEITIIELARKIIKQLNSKSEIVFLPALEEGDMKRRKPDLTKMRTVLDRGLTSLSEGINITSKSFIDDAAK